MGNKRKTLLIVPPNISYADFVFPAENVKAEAKNGRLFGAVITDMPLGVIALASYAKKIYGGDVVIIDFNVLLNSVISFEYESFKDYFEHILDQDVKGKDYLPDIIGVSVLFSTAYNNMLALGEVCRELWPDSLILAGGNVPTVSYKQIYNDTDLFHAVCYGEGETPLADLLMSQDMRQHIRESGSWITEEKVAKSSEYSHVYIKDLDEIPFDYSFINVDDYQVNPTVRYYTSVAEKGKSFNIMTSRGCPFKCIFCASHRTHGREMRYESLGRVKNNIQLLKDSHQVQVVTIEDDHFMGDKNRAYQIVKYIGELGLTAFFPNSLALYALERDMLQALKDAGVDQLILAVESGSDRVLKKVMKKPLKLDIVRRVAQDCRDIGIYTDCNILIGLPGETKEDIADTRSFLRTVGANWFRINVATPLLGSEMYDICEDKGYFKGIAIESNYKKAVVETEEFTADYIQDTTYDMNIDLNFVNNYDFLNGNYELALKGFENTLKAKPDHAIALHYASLCYGYVGDFDKKNFYGQRALLSANEPFWKNYINKYGICFE